MIKHPTNRAERRQLQRLKDYSKGPKVQKKELSDGFEDQAIE